MCAQEMLLELVNNGEAYLAHRKAHEMTVIARGSFAKNVKARFSRSQGQFVFLQLLRELVAIARTLHLLHHGMHSLQLVLLRLVLRA